MSGEISWNRMTENDPFQSKTQQDNGGNRWGGGGGNMTNEKKLPGLRQKAYSLDKEANWMSSHDNN